MSLILLNCKERTELNTDLKPTYSDFQNDWQVRNIFGKIKQIEFYKATYQDNEKEPEPILVFVEKFTKFGSLQDKSNYDSFGNLFQKDVYEFDKELLIENISSDKFGNENYTLIIETDTIKNFTKNKWYKNDSLVTTMELYYNSKDLLEKKIVYEHNDTTITLNKYKFDESGNVIMETEISEKSNDTIQQNEYSYNEDGNLTKSINKMGWMTLVTDTKWENDRINEQKKYTISTDLQKHLNEVIEYDKLFNPVNSKIYKKSKLKRELKYDYEFDQKGNWIKKTVSMKEHFENSNKFIPIYIESRKIKYWN